MRTPRMVGATAGNHAGALHAMAGVVAVCSVLVDHRPDRHNVKVSVMIQLRLFLLA
jgi:hypothetical protein